MYSLSIDLGVLWIVSKKYIFQAGQILRIHFQGSLVLIYRSRVAENLFLLPQCSEPAAKTWIQHANDCSVHLKSVTLSFPSSSFPGSCFPVFTAPQGEAARSYPMDRCCLRYCNEGSSCHLQERCIRLACSWKWLQGES